MSQSWQNRDHVNLSIPEDLLVQFEGALARDGLSMAKAVSQFLGNYIEHLDRSFVGDDCPRGPEQRKVSRSFILPEAICSRAREKASREGVRLSRLVEQFIRNYVDFANEKGGKASLPE